MRDRLSEVMAEAAQMKHGDIQLGFFHDRAEMLGWWPVFREALSCHTT